MSPPSPKVQRRDLKEDRVYVALVGAADFFARNRLRIGLVVLALVAIFAIAYFSHLRSQRLAVEASWALSQAQKQELPSEKIAALGEVVAEYGGSAAAKVAQSEIANLYYGLERYEEAIEVFQQFLKQNPGHVLAPAALEGIGYCREALQQWSEARDSYLKLMERYAGSAQAKRAHYRLGVCYENLGETEKAIESYEKTMALLPETLWVEYANARLASLRLSDGAPVKSP